MIFILNKQEQVINTLSNNGDNSGANPFYDDVLTQDLATGAETFSFSTLNQKNLSEDLAVGNHIAFKEDGKYKLFQIVQMTQTHDDDMEISVYAECFGLSLINQVYRSRKLTSATFRKFLESVLESTEINVGAIDIGLSSTLDLDLPDSSCYATLQNNLAQYNAEIEFRVEINSGRISRKFIDAYVQRGKVTGKRFSFGKDIEGITKTVDSTELYTALIGKGKNDLNFRDITIEGIDKPVGQDFVADQASFELYNKNGYHLIGIYEYDTESKEELLRATHKQLQKVKNPKIKYEVSVALLSTLLDKRWDKVRIGDFIGICDSSFNPPLTLMARVSKLETSFTNPQANKCTLSNFIEVSSNISDEMRKIAAELEGFVNNQVSSKFPIKTEDIADGAVNGDKIYQNSIYADHIQADAITSREIKADAIQAEHINANQITAEHIQAGVITAEKLEAEIIKANSALIADAAIGTAQIADAAINNAKIGNLSVDTAKIADASITNAKIKDLNADKITAGDINADRITTGVINAINANIGSATIDSAKIGELDAGKITTGELDADRIGANTIDASKITIEDFTNYAVAPKNGNFEGKPSYYLKNVSQVFITKKLHGISEPQEFLITGEVFTVKKGTNAPFVGFVWRDAKGTSVGGAGTQSIPNTVQGEYTKFSITIKTNAKPSGAVFLDGKLQASNSENHFVSLELRKKNGGELIVDGTITANKLQADCITSDKIVAGAITTEKITAQAVTTEKISANAITADKIDANAITADKISANSIKTEHIQAGAIEANKISAEAIATIGLSASEITAEKIETGEIKVGNANIVDGSISGAKISNASITNAQIDKAFIADAYIKNLDAGKITTGKLDATKVSIGSNSGNLTLADNTLTIKDNQAKPITRVQMGKDAQGNYGLVIVNADGKAIFDASKGVLIPEGLGNSVVSTDKIIDDAVGSTKLNTDELFVGENAFINKLKAVEISAANITTGTISNERIDMKGMISFEAFDETIQPMFDVQGDKTFINGGMIATNSIKADRIDLLSGLTVKAPDGTTSFAIQNNGNVEVNGLLHSGNFDENKHMGYKISPDGTAILNQARVTGEFVMPNAGITNYGATVGNENINSYEALGHYAPYLTLVEKTNSSVTYKVRRNLIAIRKNNYIPPNGTYTISGKILVNSKPIKEGFFSENRANTYNRGTSTLTYGENGYFSITEEWNRESPWFLHTESDFLKVDDILEVIELKFEVGTEATPWCPAQQEQFDYTRVWAGASYQNRDNAPFRVTQKGDVWATNATLNGRLLGDYDNGKVHIHNNEIVINDTSTKMTSFGHIRSITPFHHSKDAHIVLASGQSMLNTDVLFGSYNDKRIEYSNDNRMMNFHNTTLAYSKDSTNLVVDGAGWQGFKLGNNDGTVFSAGYSTHDTWLGTTILTHKGIRGKGYYKDVNIRRYDMKEDIEVQVEGNVTLRNSLKSTKQNIEMRSVANEGWGFFAT